MLKRLKIYKIGDKTGKGLITIFDQGIASTTNFITSIIIGRACAKDEFGYYLLGFTIIVAFFSIQNSLVAGPYTIHSPTLKDTEKRYYSGSTLVNQLGLVFISVVILSIISVIANNPRLTRVLWALEVSMGFILLKEYVRRISFAHLDVISALIVDIFVATIQISGLLLLAHFGKLSAPRAYLVLGLSSSLVTICWFVWKHKWFSLRLNTVKSDMVLNWALGRWIFAGVLIYTLSQEAYPWILTLFHDIAVTGELAACKGLIFLSNPFVLGMTNFLGPATAQTYAEGGIDKLCHLLRKTTFLIGAVIVLFCVFLLFFGEQLLVIIYGIKYAGNGLVVFIYSLSVLANVLTVPIGLGLWAIRRPDITFKASSSSLLVTVVLGIWLVKYFGLLGVVLGLLACNMIESIFKLYAFRKLIMKINRNSIAEHRYNNE